MKLFVAICVSLIGRICGFRPIGMTGCNGKRHLSVIFDSRKYPISRKYFEESIRLLNSRNATIQLTSGESNYSNATIEKPYYGYKRIIISKDMFKPFFQNQQDDDDNLERDDNDPFYTSPYSKQSSDNKSKKSKNFEIVSQTNTNFTNIGGYESVKTELYQCVDLLKNYTKYAEYNVRVPKGLIFEGPPGNGKTLIAKALAGEAGVNFITVSGSEFQEKYVGVGAARIRELFELARKNTPCIIFIDEIDALGRSRAVDGESSSTERDNTLNELLVALDGFKENKGVFLIGATNRADLLDPALVRPGRVDKRVFIGNPDKKTREEIIRIHIHGKPFDTSVIIEDIVDLTNGFSGAQIENLLNEAMLNALRYNHPTFSNTDVELVYNKFLAGWQPTEHQFTNDVVEHIAIHEMGHVIVGLLSKHHSKVSKVIINLSSPKSPAYTIFENSDSDIYTREALFEHLMILLAGRIAEEVFYGVSVTTGANNDIEETLKLAEKMIVYYGMGEKIIYPRNSEKYKEIIDTEVTKLIEDAYIYSEFIIRNAKDFIFESAEILKNKKVLKYEELLDMIQTKYRFILELKISQ